MTLRCSLCGEFESENVVILRSAEACFDCIDALVESEIEKRGVAEDARMFAIGQSGDDALLHQQSEAQKVK